MVILYQSPPAFTPLLSTNRLVSSSNGQACLPLHALRVRLSRPRRAQHVSHGVVTFMTGVLEEVHAGAEIDHGRPRPGKGVRVDHGYFVAELLVPHPAQPLDQAERRAGSPVVGPTREI